MLYAKLVARISEVTRTLVARGESAEFDQNSTVLTAEVDVRNPHDVQGGWLRVIEGAARGTYQVVRVSGHHVHVAEPFPATERGVAWELYDQGVSEEDVRKVLFHFPDVLMECDEGEKVKTYLGVIKIVRRKRKRVKDLQGRWTHSPERLQARLRPGKRLQRLLEGPDASGPPTSPLREEEPEDEDPTP
jgi:hypothetical protein